MNGRLIAESRSKVIAECHDLLFRSQALIGQTEFSLHRSRLAIHDPILVDLLIEDGDVRAIQSQRPMNLQSSVLQLARSCETLLDEQFKLESLTLEEHLLLEAYACRMKDRFELKKLQ